MYNYVGKLYFTTLYKYTNTYAANFIETQIHTQKNKQKGNIKMLTTKC